MLDNITRLCFGASYAVALVAAIGQAIWPRRAWRWVGLVFGGAGLIAHSAFLLWQRPTPAMPFGSLLLLAWVLAVFYFYGAIHHRRLAWAVFVLPVVLGLVVMAGWFPPDAKPEASEWIGHMAGERFWGFVHGALLLLASVGVCVGGIASLMYLEQARRLRAKAAPGAGLKLLSLERLEAMNRRAINAAFPLLTAGLVVGAWLGYQRDGTAGPWVTAKVLGTIGLWLTNGVLLMLRYSLRARGRLLALGTLLACIFLLTALAASHPFVGGAGP